MAETSRRAAPAVGGDAALAVPGIGLLRRVFRYEDLVLFGFTVLVQPLLLKGTDAGGISDISDVGPITGAFFLVAFVGACLCLATRAEGAPRPRIDSDAMTPSEWAPFPFLGALALIGSAGIDGLGLPGLEILLGPLAILGVAVYFGASKLPTASRQARRLLMLPMILAGSSLFAGTMAEIDLFGLGVGLVQLFGSNLNGILAALLFTVAIPGPFFVMFVFAPRQLADSEGTWGTWVLRYWVYLAGTVISVWWLRALGV